MNPVVVRLVVVFLAALAWAGVASAQFPPMFMGGPPGFAQFQAMALQRHQARTLLYREALEELRKNPQAADVPVCAPGIKPKAGECLLPPAPAVPVVAIPPAAIAHVQPVAPVASPTEAPAPVASPAPIAPGQRLALLIGNQGYKPPIPPLETPIADVTRIGTTIEKRFGFAVRILRDAGKDDIISALNRIAGQSRPEDSVLIFYAGHGYQMDDTGLGFWIPVDASVKTAKGWIANDDIARLLAAIPARQIILVSDSCFAGTLAREKKLKATATLSPDDVLRRRSVLVMTSGDEEPVSDEGKDGHSIFAWNLIRALESAQALTPGFEVWRNVHRGVTKEYPQQPQYGAVISAGHVEGGEFLFRSVTRQ